MNKYSIVSEIRQSIKGDFGLSFTILRNGERCWDHRFPNKVISLNNELIPLCQCGDNYGYSKTYEEVKARKEKFDGIIVKVFPNKEQNKNTDPFFKIIESYVFS
jgi:hypothetical protein